MQTLIRFALQTLTNKALAVYTTSWNLVNSKIGVYKLANAHAIGRGLSYLFTYWLTRAELIDEIKVHTYIKNNVIFTISSKKNRNGIYEINMVPINK